MAPDLPLAVPVPIGHGVPGEGYPWYWTVCPWLTCELATRTPVADLGRAATSLARFVAALQAIDPVGGLVHEFRGVSLAAHDHNARTAVAVLEHSLVGSTVIFTPANMLVKEHELSAVIDFGLLGVGDSACDLMVAWTYLSADSRDVFRTALAVDDATWSRGRGWALQFGLRAAAYSADNPVLADIGRYTLAEVLADFDDTRS